MILKCIHFNPNFTHHILHFKVLPNKFNVACLIFSYISKFKFFLLSFVIPTQLIFSTSYRNNSKIFKYNWFVFACARKVQCSSCHSICHFCCFCFAFGICFCYSFMTASVFMSPDAYVWQTMRWQFHLKC